MEPTQGKPIRKRRSWLIVPFVLALISLISWWNWPQIDPRLVGKWHHLNEAAVAPIEFTLILKDDGTGTLAPISHDPHFEDPIDPEPIGWWVRENELFLLRSSGGPPGVISRLLAALGATKTRRLTIVRVTDREIHYRTEAFGPTELVMNRVE